MNEINTQFENANSVFEKLRKEIEIDLKKSSFPNSVKALLICSDKIDEIGKILMYSEINFYSSQVLLRVLFEHYLLSEYIFSKANKEKSDSIGEKYYDEYLCGEFFKRVSYSKQVDKIIEKNNKKQSQLEIIKETFPEFKDLNEKKIEDINRIKNSFFDLKKIGEFFINSESNKNVFTEFNMQKLELIKRYSDLSSFVHGGPLAEKDFLSFNTEVKVKIIIENSDWFKIASYYSKRNALNLLATDFGVKYLIVLKSLN